ncbi:MAG: thioesterase family protein [Cellvibrionaceae bacterium]|nr:thioesterase family protein [Cellvibrionaceae bacterium]
MSSMSNTAPTIYRTNIQPEWLDHSDHLNVAYYVLIFSKAGEALLANLGLNAAATRESGISWMVLENHISYNREVMLDQAVRVTAQLLDNDDKRLHLYFEMWASAEDGSEYLASSLEQMAMCVDIKLRKSCPLPAAITAKVAAMASAHADLPKPQGIGRAIGIRR